MPNVDGVVLTQSIGAAISSGQFNRVPVIEGTNHDEFRLFVALLFELPNGPVTAAQYPAYVAALLGLPAAVSAQVVPAVVAEYPLSSYPSPAIALGAIGTLSLKIGQGGDDCIGYTAVARKPPPAT